MSKRRVHGMIVLVWLCSGLISFPAILWWRISAAVAASLPAPYGTSANGSSAAVDARSDRSTACTAAPLTPAAAADWYSSRYAGQELMLPFTDLNVLDGEYATLGESEHSFSSSSSSSSSIVISAFRNELDVPTRTATATAPSAVPSNEADAHNASASAHGFCEFTEDPFYLLASATVSFWVPSALMFYLYFRIYKTARKVKRNLETGERSLSRKKTRVTRAGAEENTADGESDGSRGPGKPAASKAKKSATVGRRRSLVLRVHRGGGRARNIGPSKSMSAAATTTNTPVAPRAVAQLQAKSRISDNSSVDTSNTALTCATPLLQAQPHTPLRSSSRISSPTSLRFVEERVREYPPHTGTPPVSPGFDKETSPMSESSVGTPTPMDTSLIGRTDSVLSRRLLPANVMTMSLPCGAAASVIAPLNTSNALNSNALTHCATGESVCTQSTNESFRAQSSLSVRRQTKSRGVLHLLPFFQKVTALREQLRRLTREQKAAKTLGTNRHPTFSY